MGFQPQGHERDALPAYALGTLEDEELVSVGRHLDECADCREELRAYQNVAGQLGFAAAMTAPPPALKQKILDNIHQESLMRTRKGEARTGPAGFGRPVRIAWSIASLVLILVLGVTSLLLWQQANQMRGTAGSTDFRAVAMAGAEGSPQASGVLIISHDGKHGTLVVDDLPVLETGREYQLWLIDADQTRISGGTFRVQPDGYGALWILSDRPLESYPRFGVTIEPAGGSPQPTGPRVMAGGL